MSLKYSVGFLIASLVQAAIIMLTEALAISSLGAKLTITQLIIHIFAGQIAGYILLFIMTKVSATNQTNTWTTGSIYGIIVWAILLSINSTLGTVRAPWSQGVLTILSSMIAFITYGIIATYVIRKYSYNKIDA